VALSGRGFLALWNGVDPEREPEYNRWHSREHVPERVDIPGMIAARRYVDGQGPLPKYFTLYDLESTAVLTSAPYRRLLETPSAWSRSMRPSFRGFLRFGCVTVASLGGGLGGVAATITLRGSAANDAAIVSAVLSDVLLLPAFTAAHLGTVDDTIPGVPFTIGGEAPTAPPDAVLLLESFDRAALDAALPVVDAQLNRAGLMAAVTSWTVYRLGYVIARTGLADLVLVHQ